MRAVTLTSSTLQPMLIYFKKLSRHFIQSSVLIKVSHSRKYSIDSIYFSDLKNQNYGGKHISYSTRNLQSCSCNLVWPHKNIESAPSGD